MVELTQPTREVKATISKHFGELHDPRKEGMVEHKLLDMVTIAVCGAQSGVDVELFGRSRGRWLKQFLELPGGIPSHDTFGRVFALLNAEQFQRGFGAWMQEVCQRLGGEGIAIDGKTLRGSYDRNKAAIQMVSAWAQANRVVLGQVKTDAKSNEITAFPHLLKFLDIPGGIVTIDARGCQKAIAEQILAAKGD